MLLSLLFIQYSKIRIELSTVQVYYFIILEGFIELLIKHGESNTK